MQRKWLKRLAEKTFGGDSSHRDIRGTKLRKDDRERSRERGVRYGGNCWKRGGRGGNITNESRNSPHSPVPPLPGSLSTFLSLSVGAAYVFRCMAGCTAANGVSNIFLSAFPALLFARLHTLSRVSVRPLDRFSNSFLPFVYPPFTFIWHRPNVEPLRSALVLFNPLMHLHAFWGSKSACAPHKTLSRVHL